LEFWERHRYRYLPSNEERKQLDYEIVVNSPLMGRGARTFQEELEVHLEA
jgi:hypothetical protein